MHFAYVKRPEENKLYLHTRYDSPISAQLRRYPGWYGCFGPSRIRFWHRSFLFSKVKDNKSNHANTEPFPYRPRNHPSTNNSTSTYFWGWHPGWYRKSHAFMISMYQFRRLWNFHSQFQNLCLFPNQSINLVFRWLKILWVMSWKGGYTCMYYKDLWEGNQTQFLKSQIFFSLRFGSTILKQNWLA